MKQISTTLDNYVYTPDEQLIEGEIESGKRYTETDFKRLSKSVNGKRIGSTPIISHRVDPGQVVVQEDPRHERGPPVAARLAVEHRVDGHRSQSNRRLGAS